MAKIKYDCYLVKKVDGSLLKFSYEDERGIYCQMLINKEWSDKKSIYKECFGYFYVLHHSNGNIHLFCQNICGDIILCTLQGGKWEYNNIFHIGVSMPRYIRAFFVFDYMQIFYHIVDSQTYSEMLIHQSMQEDCKWSPPQMISKLDASYQFPYKINGDGQTNFIVVNTSVSDVYQITSRTFYIYEREWGKEKIIHISQYPYKDYNFCVKDNKKHYLFITQEDEINRVIYQSKEIGLEKDTILFQHKKIESCLFLQINTQLWALWISENKLYGSLSINNGQDFNKPKIIEQYSHKIPVKVFYQECVTGKESVDIPNEIYTIEKEGEEILYLPEMLESLVAKIAYLGSDLDSVGEKEKCNKVVEEENHSLVEEKILLKDIENLKIELKKLQDQLTKSYEDIENEKNQTFKLQSQLHQEKDKNRRYMHYNDQLKEKNRYVEKELIVKEKEMTTLNNEFMNIKRENEEFHEQLDVVRIQSLPKDMKEIKKSTKNKPKHRLSSVAKWFFEDEKNE